MTFDELPDVIPDALLAKYFGIAPRTLRYRRQMNTWPIPEIRGMKCRTSKAVLGRHLEIDQQTVRRIA